MNAIESSSTRPYLIRALYEWCSDNGLTPYVAVAVDDTVQVPREYVKNGEIVLNISYDATSALTLGNDFIAFKARFAGTAREIMVPMERVIAIYARENGQGMAFPLGAPAVSGASAAPDTSAAATGPVQPPGLSAGSALRIQPQAQAPAVAEAGAEYGKVVQLVQLAPPPSEAATVPAAELPDAVSVDGPEDPEPPRPTPGAGPRPSLKRIK